MVSLSILWQTIRRTDSIVMMNIGPQATGTNKRKAPSDATVSAEASRITKSAKTKENNAPRGRPRVREFGGMLRAILTLALAHYRCCIAAVYAFPTNEQADDMAIQAWAKACSIKKAQVPMEAEQLVLVRNPILYVDI